MLITLVVIPRVWKLPASVCNYMFTCVLCDLDKLIRLILKGSMELLNSPCLYGRRVNSGEETRCHVLRLVLERSVRYGAQSWYISFGGS